MRGGAGGAVRSRGRASRRRPCARGARRRSRGGRRRPRRGASAATRGPRVADERARRPRRARRARSRPRGTRRSRRARRRRGEARASARRDRRRPQARPRAPAPAACRRTARPGRARAPRRPRRTARRAARRRSRRAPRCGRSRRTSSSARYAAPGACPSPLLLRHREHALDRPSSASSAIVVTPRVYGVPKARWYARARWPTCSRSAPSATPARPDRWRTSSRRPTTRSTTDERDRLYTRSPYNVVHLTLPDSAEEAGRLYRDWLADGILERDDEPAVLARRRGLRRPRRRRARAPRCGRLAAAEPYETGTVLPHERTHPRIREERLRLLRATRVQPEPIFLLSDGALGLDVPARAPGSRRRRHAALAAAGRDAAGLREPAAPDRRRPPPLRERRRARRRARLRERANHGSRRLDRRSGPPGLPDAPCLLEPAGSRGASATASRVASLDEALARLGDEPFDRSAAVAYRRDGVELVRGPEASSTSSSSTATGSRASGTRRGSDEAVAAVDSGAADVAFLAARSRGSRTSSRVARRGERMPQKSTYFFPKPLSGLLFHPVGDDGLARHLSALRRGHPRGARAPADASRSASRCCGSARAATTRRRSTRRPRTPSSRGSPRSRRTSCSSRRSSASGCSARAARGGSSSTRSTARSTRSAGSRSSRSRSPSPRADDGRRRVRLRLRLRLRRGVDGRARQRRVPQRRAARRRGPKDPIEILSFEGTTTATIAERIAAVARARRRAAGHGLARALALPSGCRARRRRLLAQAGALGRHRRRAAARARVRLAIELFEDPPFGRRRSISSRARASRAGRRLAGARSRGSCGRACATRWYPRSREARPRRDPEGARARDRPRAPQARDRARHGARRARRGGRLRLRDDRAHRRRLPAPATRSRSRWRSSSARSRASRASGSAST